MLHAENSERRVAKSSARNVLLVGPETHDEIRTRFKACRQGPPHRQTVGSHCGHCARLHHRGFDGGRQSRIARLRQFSYAKPRCPKRAQSENRRSDSGAPQEGAVLQGREGAPREIGAAGEPVEQRRREARYDRNKPVRSEHATTYIRRRTGGRVRPRLLRWRAGPNAAHRPRRKRN